MLLRQMLKLFWKRDPNILLEDNFDGSAVNTNFWVTTDTESKITVSGGNLDFSGGKATPAWTDPAAVSKKSWARVTGLTVEWQITPVATNKDFMVGFTNGMLSVGGLEAHSFNVAASALVYVYFSTSSAKVPFTYSAAQVLWGQIQCIVQPDGTVKGALYSISTVSENGPWMPIWVDATVTITPLYIFAESYDAAFTSSGVKVKLLSPKPPVISVTPAAPTLTLGDEEASGALVVGKWYKITATQANYFFTGCAIGNIFRATATTALDANNKVQNIALSTTGVLTYLGDSGIHNGVYQSKPTVSAGYHQGIVAHADSATAPTYCLLGYYDRTAGKAYLLKNVNETWTELVASTATYSAGAVLEIISNGSSHGLYYNKLLQGSIQTLDVSSNYGTHVHYFATENAAPGLCEARV